jgi:hypothetical protein
MILRKIYGVQLAMNAAGLLFKNSTREPAMPMGRYFLMALGGGFWIYYLFIVEFLDLLLIYSSDGEIFLDDAGGRFLDLLLIYKIR